MAATAVSAAVYAKPVSVSNKAIASPFSPLHSLRRTAVPPLRSPASPLRRRRRSFSAKVATELELMEVSSDVEIGWKEFAKNVSGEWDGFGADFTSYGTPIELPESVVPEAYREWEVKVLDWQTQCPTLALDEELSMTYKVIKLLPTVGCEADAATRYSIDERHIGGNKVAAFAYHPTGCYLALWPIENQTSSKMFELEHCLVDPQNREVRVRVIQVVRLEERGMKMCKIKVFCEQWYGPFRNGDQLGGCAIRDSGFASTEVLKESEILGVWEGPSSAACFQKSQTGCLKELKSGKPQKETRNQYDQVLLPRQLWCSLRECENSGVLAEVGWLFGQGKLLSSKFVFSNDGTLKEVAIGQEALV